jgi:hypothetical protein
MRIVALGRVAMWRRYFFGSRKLIEELALMRKSNIANAA